ncbi:HD-GYP domain-containing protein [Paenibacillus yanchengensis]|uniref:HD-GYP domain-containing protein n=1 Tax=Paenibacillus yanchengensis TaxID=2035833 RepID=A0ABW4YFY7_9BACL
MILQVGWPTKFPNKDELEKTIRVLERKLGIPVDSMKHYERLIDILSTILFPEKKEPWYFFVPALARYSDWLYVHCIHVALLSLIIGNKFGYTKQMLFELALGAFFHDIGKIYIPMTILDKPDKLTAVETDIMREHARLGVAALSRYKLPATCLEIIGNHHERLDGSGYPQGLTADKISEQTQIVMVMDALDAISANRPYQVPRSFSQALTIIAKEKDKYAQHIVAAVAEL